MALSDFIVECPLKAKHPCKDHSQCVRYNWHSVDGSVSTHRRIRISLLENGSWYSKRNLTEFGKRQYLGAHHFGLENLENQVYNPRDWKRVLEMSHCTMTNDILEEANSSFATARADVTIHLFECVCQWQETLLSFFCVKNLTWSNRESRMTSAREY